MQDILNAVKIVDVYSYLTGRTPRPTGHNCYRGPATWRNGDGLNVSLDNDRGVWHDFATDDGGGILDLIVRIQGGTRYEALKWAAEFAGVSLEIKDFTPEQRIEWVEARKALERDLPDARYWYRAAVNTAQEDLVYLKAGLFDPGPDSLQLSEGIFSTEQWLARLLSLQGQRLVEEYRWWREHYPGMTEAMVKAAKKQESLERQVVLRLIREMTTDGVA